MLLLGETLYSFKHTASTLAKLGVTAQLFLGPIGEFLGNFEFTSGIKSSYVN